MGLREKRWKKSTGETRSFTLPVSTICVIFVAFFFNYLNIVVTTLFKTDDYHFFWGTNSDTATSVIWQLSFIYLLLGICILFDAFLSSRPTPFEKICHIFSGLLVTSSIFVFKGFWDSAAITNPNYPGYFRNDVAIVELYETPADMDAATRPTPTCVLKIPLRKWDGDAFFRLVYPGSYKKGSGNFDRSKVMYRLPPQQVPSDHWGLGPRFYNALFTDVLINELGETHQRYVYELKYGLKEIDVFEGKMTPHNFNLFTTMIHKQALQQGCPFKQPTKHPGWFPRITQRSPRN